MAKQKKSKKYAAGRRGRVEALFRASVFWGDSQQSPLPSNAQQKLKVLWVRLFWATSFY